MTIPTTTGQTDMQLWINRDLDGAIQIRTKRPLWNESVNCWLSTDGNYDVVSLFFQGTESWPETFLPRGKMGLARLIVDPASVASATDAKSSS